MKVRHNPSGIHECEGRVELKPVGRGGNPRVRNSEVHQIFRSESQTAQIRRVVLSRTLKPNSTIISEEAVLRGGIMLMVYDPDKPPLRTLELTWCAR